MEQSNIEIQPKKSFFHRWWWIGIVLFIILILIFLFIKRPNNATPATDNTVTKNTLKSSSNNNFQKPFSQPSEKTDEPIFIKNLPVNIAPYDANTNMAGDFKFTKQHLEFDRLYFDYGYYIPANSASPAKNNPQPTFVVPLGTKVHSIVDGTVIQIPKLYSDDYSVIIAKDENSQIRYETEHVKNVLVEVGDAIKAGDVVAEVSDYDTRNTPGYGLVEMGILKGGNPPKHLCPYMYLDPSVKDSILNSLKQFYTDWNTYKGKTIYDTSKTENTGCLTVEEIEG